MKLLSLIVLALLLTVSVAGAQEPAPYLYYFSDVLHSYVIERADGSDSRQFGEAVIPATHNSASGPGWSPSGRWFAFTSHKGGAYDGSDWRSYIISTDEQTIIPFLPQEGLSRSDIVWSPVEDLLVYTDTQQISDYGYHTWLVLFDPNTQQPIYKHFFDGEQTSAGSVRWSPDGSQISIEVSQEGTTHLYDLTIPALELKDSATLNKVHDIYDNNSTQLLAFINAEKQLVIHDIFSHQEWKYPFDYPDSYSRLISMTWNPQQTEALIQIEETAVDSQRQMSILWLFLTADRLVVIRRNDPFSFSPTEGVIWSPEGNKAVIDISDKRGNKVVVFTPSLKQKMMPPMHRPILWLDGHHFLFEEKSGESIPALKIIDMETLQTQPVGIPMGVPNYSLAPSRKYLQVGRSIYELSSLQVVAQSQTSASTMETFTSWHENDGWVIFMEWDFFPLSGYRSMVYEVAKINDSNTRELTNCYWSLCAGWLPPQVEPLLTPDASPKSVIPAPSQEILVEKPIYRLAWNEDGTQIKTISADWEAEVATVNVWEVNTGKVLQTEDIPYDEIWNYKLDGDTVFANGNWDKTQPLVNPLNTLQFTYEATTQTYAVQDLKTRQVLQTWIGDEILFNDETSYRWIGELLFIDISAKGCNRYWQRYGEKYKGMVSTPIPMFCNASPNEDFVLLLPIHAAKTYLVNTLTGNVIPINFYASDGAFSPDGTRIALGSSHKLTIWELQDILSI
ncbi:MAG TPA: hypothetical protein VHO69_10340 [Phototrophicaceae bacterium]|nr:hypothetical protein [Phototrophicaceae bacterium]